MNQSYFITGVTGLIGRHVLYELLTENFKENLNNTIFVSIRETKQSPKARLNELFKKGSCVDYLLQFPLEQLTKNIKIIPSDLIDLDLKSNIEHFLPKNTIVIHSAASTNLANGESAETDISNNNMFATQNLLKAINKVCKKFIYISSSFAIGDKKGLIKNDYLQFNEFNSRNPYERYKLSAEKEVELYCNYHKLDWQVLRPSIVCGRLSQTPLYYMSKFDVFYGFAKFFYLMHKKNAIKETVRVQCTSQSSLNIIPADYAAKAICDAIKTPIKQLNIVHKNSVNSQQLVVTILKEIGIQSVEFVDRQPRDLSKIERFYYATVGAIFTNYLCTPEQKFEVSTLTEITKNYLPKEILPVLPNLIRHAINCEFEPNKTLDSDQLETV